MNHIFFNSFKKTRASIKKHTKEKMSCVEKNVDGKLNTTYFISAQIVFYNSKSKTSFIGKSASVIKSNTKLKIEGTESNMLRFYRYNLPNKLGDVSFKRPKPISVPVSQFKQMKFDANMLNSYEKKVVEVVLSEKPLDTGGVSGTFELEFNMLRGEIRTFKMPFKYLQTLENTNGASVSGEYLTFSPEEIGEYHFRGQGGFMKIKVSPALVMQEINIISV